MPIPRTPVLPLKIFRVRSGIKQYLLAEAIGQSGWWLSLAERGAQTVTLEEARALSKILRVPIKKLFPDGLPVVQKRRLPSRTIPRTPRTMDIFNPAPDPAHEGGK